MSDVTIDSVSVEIKSSSDKASKGIDNLVLSLSRLKTATTGGLAGLKSYNEAIKSLKNNVSNIEQITSKAVNAAQKINTATGQISSPKIDTSSMENTKATIDELTSKFGELKSETSKDGLIQTQTFQKQEGALKTITTIKNGHISQNKRIINQEENINQKMKKAGSLLRGLGLTALLKQAFNQIGGLVQKSADYIQTVRLFNTVMGESRQKAEEFVNRFSTGLGIDDAYVRSYMSSFKQIISGFGLTEEASYTMSKNLTQLAYDMSVAYAGMGVTVEDAMQKLKSGISGELEPMRAIGVALDQNTLQQTANTLGIKKRVTEMTRAQKTELLYYQIMHRTTNAQGQFSKQLLQPATAIIQLRQQFSQLGRAIGNIFIPILMAAMPYIQAITQLLMEAAQAIAAFFGFQLDTKSGISAGISNAATGLEDVGDSADKAKKKVEGMLAPFDELNTIDFDKGGAGGGAGGGAAGGGSLGIPLYDYDALNGALEKTKEKVQKIKDWFYNIKDYVIAIGAALLTWKIAKGVANFLSALGIGNGVKNLRIAAAAAITVGSVTLAVSAIKDFENGKITGGLLKSLAAGLGVSVAAGLVGLSLPISALLGITFTGITITYGLNKFGENTATGILLKTIGLPDELRYTLNMMIAVNKIIWSGLEKILPEETLKKLMKNMLERVAKELENYGPLGKAIASGIRAGISESRDDMSNTVTYESKQALLAANPWVKDSAKGLGRDSMKAYNSGFSEKREEIKRTTINTTTKAINDSTSSVKTSSKTLASSANKSFRDNINAKESGEKVKSTFNTGLSNNTNLNNIDRSSKTIGKNVNTKIKENADGKGIGTNVTAGIASGMESSTTSKSTFASKVKAVGSTVLSLLKTSLGIHSPSRVMRDYVGKFIPLGIAEGIDIESYTIKNSLYNIADDIREIGQSELTTSLGVSYDEITGQIQSKTEVSSNIDSATFARQVGEYCYDAILRGFNENQPVNNVYVGNDKVYSGYGNYQNRQSNKYGTNIVRV